MKVNVISGSHHSFKARADQILDIYNKESSAPFDECLNITKLESVRLIYVEGVEGGVITDQWCSSTGEFLFHSIMFAAFPKHERKKGHLKACIEQAGFPVETVQINGGDPIEVWRKLGFTKSGTLGFTTMLRSRDFNDVNWGMCVVRES